MSRKESEEFYTYFFFQFNAYIASIMFYKDEYEDLKNSYQVPNMIGIICYFSMKYSYYQYIIRKKSISDVKSKFYGWTHYFLFIIWNTFFSFSVSILCNTIENRVYVISEYLLIYQEIYFYLKVDFKQSKIIKGLPVIYSIFISGITTRSFGSLSDEKHIWADIILFLMNSFFIVVVSYFVNERFEKKAKIKYECTDSKFHAEIQKVQGDKNSADCLNSQKIGNNMILYNKEIQHGIQIQTYQENGTSLHILNGSKQQQMFKSSGANLSHYHQDRGSHLTLKNIEVDDLTKTMSNNPLNHGENGQSENTSFKDSSQQCIKQQATDIKMPQKNNGNFVQQKNGNKYHKANSSSLLQLVRNFDEQIQKSQNDLSFNNITNKKEEVQETSNNHQLQEYFSMNQRTCFNTSQAISVEPSSQPNIHFYPSSATQLNQRKSQISTVTQLAQNESILSSGFYNDRTKQREPTVAFFNQAGGASNQTYNTYQHNNSKIMEKSTEDIMMSEINNEYETSYHILNNVDFAAFKFDIQGSWKVDFHNQAAKKLLEQNNGIGIAQIFKKITILSLSKESQNTINNLGLMNNDYKFSPQIKHTSFKQSKRTNELNKYARGSIHKQEHSIQNTPNENNYSSPSRKIDFSVLKLPSNINPSLSMKQSTYENSNIFPANSNSRASNLYSNIGNQIQSPSNFNTMTVYQFINNIKNSLKSLNVDLSQSAQTSNRFKSTADRSCQKIQIETFSLEDNISLFSNEDIIKIFIVNNKQIIVIIENMQKYYNTAKNQVTKTIQSGMIKTISHEIGTHLSILFSILNVCMADPQMTEQLKEEYLIPFQQNMMLIYLLIQDFKDYQDILLGRFRIKSVKSDIKKLLYDTIELVQKQAQDKKIQININIEDNIQNMIHIDPTRFKQIVINLLQNSLKFTGQNKRIDVYMQHPPDDQENIQVLVQDQGIGMEEDEQKALRMLLQEGVSENKLSLKSSGYGFGLTVSNKIAFKLNEKIKYEKENTPENKKLKNAISNQMGIEFESIPKQGSKFWFYIEQQQQILHQSINKKGLYASIMCFGDQFIEVENKTHFPKQASINHEFKGTLQADSVLIDDHIKKTENRLYVNSPNRSPQLSIENKTQSIKQSNGSLAENSQNTPKILHNNPINFQTQNNITINQLSFVNSSAGNQSPQHINIKANISTFSFNNPTSNQAYRITNENSKGTIEHTNRQIEENKSNEHLQHLLEASDHLPPIPSSSIEEKAYEVLRAKKCSDTEIISQEEKDKITSLNQFTKNINEICLQQQSSDVVLQSLLSSPYILIVDDTPSNHFCLMLYLEKIYKIPRKQIIQAYNGEEGYDMFVQYQSQIRIIFMDLNMPILDGKGSTQKIREFERNNNLESIIIVAYTAYSDPSTENECLNEYQFTYFLPKPIVERQKLKDILESAELI